MTAHRVRLRSAVSVHRDANSVRFFDGHRAVTLAGSEEAVERLAAAGRLLAQAHSASELSDALDISMDDTSDMVSAMTVLDLVAADDPPLDSLSSTEQAALTFAEAVGGSSLTAAESLARLRRMRVIVLGEDGTDLVELLRASGLTSLAATRELPDDLTPERDLVVVLAADGQDRTALTSWNERFLASATTWLPVASFDGASVVVGPLIVPGQTCCYECFLSRRASNAAFGDSFRALWLEAPAVPAPAAVRHWAQAVASLIVVRWVVQANPAMTSRVFRVDPVTTSLADAYVFPVPRCPACSAAAWQPLPAPWEVE